MRQPEQQTSTEGAQTGDLDYSFDSQGERDFSFRSSGSGFDSFLDDIQPSQIQVVQQELCDNSPGQNRKWFSAVTAPILSKESNKSSLLNRVVQPLPDWYALVCHYEWTHHTSQAGQKIEHAAK